MRFAELLRLAVLLSAGAATLLAALTVIAASDVSDPVLIYVSATWWIVAAALGVAFGRRAEVNPPIARLLATARSTSSLPAPEPGRTVLNRLWPLALFALTAAVAGFFLPQVASIATGFALVWPLSMRRQEQAVEAIEERDGARFYVERTSPFAPIALLRTPGFSGDFVSRAPSAPTP